MPSDARAVLKRLADRQYESGQERDQLLAQLAGAGGLHARDVAWMLFRPDRSYRDAGVGLLRRIADPETADVVIGECKGKPDAAVRAAAATLLALGVPGTEQRLAALALQGKPEEQEVVRRLLLDAPVTPTLQPVLWQLFASSGRPEDRQAFLAHLASGPVDARILPRWQRLARDADKATRERALVVLAQHDPRGSTELFVEQIALVDYSTQQLLVDALTRAAAGQGPEFADCLLPLMASGEPATRSAVLKILLAMPNRREVVRHYIVFSKTLAGWVRDRALESMRGFGPDLLEPTIELLSDPDQEIRASAMLVAQSFEDPRIVPATIGLLKDPDWWIRITAAETLGRLKDLRGVLPLVEALADPEARWAAVEALGRIGDLRAVPGLSQLLSDPAPEVRIEVILALSHFEHPQMLDFVRNVARQDPSRAVRARAFELAREMAARTRTKLADEDALRAALVARSGANEPKLNALLVATRNNGASDFHLSVGEPPTLRLAADLVRAKAEPFSAEQTETMVREILSEAQWERLRTERQLDFCHYIPTAGRYRGNVFVDQKGLNGVFRVIPERPPTIAEIGLPPQLAEIADHHQGLVLVCGPSGSGKSTTLAALVNLFNETRHDHVITLEDPVEFIHPFKNCLVNQREVGTDTQSFARALRAALREDPDVIVIGELRDNESVSLALTAAETGHIVLATLSSTGASKAIDRILSSFPAAEQGQIRAALSESLKYVIAQRLLPAPEARKQVACFEVLKSTVAIANMIREEKTYQIPSALQMGRSLGMQTFDEALKGLLAAGRITGATAYRAASKKQDFEAYLPGAAAEPAAAQAAAAGSPLRPSEARRP